MFSIPNSAHYEWFNNRVISYFTPGNEKEVQVLVFDCKNRKSECRKAESPKSLQSESMALEPEPSVNHLGDTRLQMPVDKSNTVQELKASDSKVQHRRSCLANPSTPRFLRFLPLFSTHLATLVRDRNPKGSLRTLSNYISLRLTFSLVWLEKEWPGSLKVRALDLTGHSRNRRVALEVILF